MPKPIAANRPPARRESRAESTAPVTVAAPVAMPARQSVEYTAEHTAELPVALPVPTPLRVRRPGAGPLAATRPKPVAAKPAPGPRYDCSRCPGYCCSYPRIELLDEDVQRLADHFGISFKKAERKFAEWYDDDERILRHRKDTIYGSICRFFDRDARRCTVYEARPGVCRDYPNGNTCGYYTFLKFERKHQDDPDFIPSA